MRGVVFAMVLAPVMIDERPVAEPADAIRTRPEVIPLALEASIGFRWNSLMIGPSIITH